jgi:hypothetical protein
MIKKSETEVGDRWEWLISQSYLTNVTPGLHTIVVKMVDYQCNVIGTSLTYWLLTYKAPAVDQYLKSFTVTPSGKINAWDTVIIDAQVDGSVRSVELKNRMICGYILWREKKMVVLQRSLALLILLEYKRLMLHYIWGMTENGISW